MKLRCAVFLMTLAILPIWSALSTAMVEWDVANTLSLKDKPRDTAISFNGEWIYVLTEKGDILIYDSNGSLKETISVGEHVESIRIGPKDNILLLTSGTEKTVQIITLDFIKVINISGSPFKGSAQAPVVIATFDDFE